VSLNRHLNKVLGFNQKPDAECYFVDRYLYQLYSPLISIFQNQTLLGWIES